MDQNGITLSALGAVRYPTLSGIAAAKSLVVHGGIDHAYPHFDSIL
jgi:hypothetical protein